MNSAWPSAESIDGVDDELQLERSTEREREGVKQMERGGEGGELGFERRVRRSKPVATLESQPTRTGLRPLLYRSNFLLL